MNKNMLENIQMLIPWICFIVSFRLVQVNAHGRLIEPPSRASMWRYGFNTPPNYNDHELYCGGFTKQWQVNGGKCGICGDPWDAPQPRQHEAGGKYGNGIIVRKYRMNAMFTIRVELTANHRGYFEFKICPNNAPKKVATQQCLDKHILKRAKYTAKESDEMYHETRFYPGPENKVYEIKYVLPSGLTCSQCVLQWKYIAGNNWGMCTNGTGAVGCGPQEEFRSCADIAISDSSATIDEKPTETTTTTTTSKMVTVTTTSKIDTTNATTIKIDTTTLDISENEIPDEDIFAYSSEQKQARDHLIFMASIVLLSFLLVIILFVLLYFYYYHARNVQKWWSNKKSGLKDLTCWSALKNKVHRSCTASKQRQDLKCQSNNVPVPPPRTKRHSIGFKGVPENLV